MSWILMVAVGIACLVGMKWTPPKIDFILVRAAALSFVGAGVIGASGILGDMLDTAVDWVVDLADRAGNAAVGVGISWFVVAAVGALWVGALLPAKVFSFDYPDWLVFSGLILPALIASVPGPAGGFLSEVITTAGETMNGAVGRMF